MTRDYNAEYKDGARKYAYEFDYDASPLHDAQRSIRSCHPGGRSRWAAILAT